MHADNSGTTPPKGNDCIYRLEGRPPLLTALPLGLQHVLAMFTANLAPILIIAGVCSLSGADTIIMVQCAMFVSGLTTFIQLYPIKLGKKFQIGSGLPIVMGTSFSFVPTACTVAATGGIGAVLGGCIAGSITEVFMGFFYPRIKKFFPPLVVGATLVTIGIKLLSAGAAYYAGGSGAEDFGSLQNLSVATFVFVLIILLQRFGKGLVKNSSLLIGLLSGYALAACLGMVHYSDIASASYFSVPMPFQLPITFTWSGVISFAAIYIVSGLETIGNTNGITIAAFDREAEEKETAGAILADSLGSVTAAVFNALPNTAFGQNVGIVSMTGVVNKFCIATGAMILMICGFVPKLGAVFASIPACVLGGAIISVFGMILINGIKMIAKAGFSERNLTVLAITFALGLGLANLPEATAQLPTVLQFIFADSVAATCIVAIIANVLFPVTDEAEKERAKRALMDLD